MKEVIRWIQNNKAQAQRQKVSLDYFSNLESERVENFHRSFSLYELTPLRRLTNLAEHLGVKEIFVKDESYRFGLNSFKVLGGSYAIGRYLAQRLGMNIEDLSFEKLKTPEIKEKLGEITFTSATDGNHGRGVAWAASQLGHKSVIYMPKGSSQTRLKNIQEAGAEAYITDLNYNDVVRLSADNAKKNGWVIVQDTAWDGYEDIPTWIMQGYSTMAAESLAQIRSLGIEQPSHIFVQAGVGSMAGAVQGFFATQCEERPRTAIVEPNAANCFYQSAEAEELKIVSGDLDTIMAGLACGEPNPIAWNILQDYSDMMISCSDNVTAKGMRILGNPLGSDSRVVSGESGAVTTGILSLIMQNKALQEIKESLKLNNNSIVLLFSTEGDTDPENYRRIVWDGAYPI